VAKQLACGDVVTGCKAVFTGKTDDEVLGQAAVHAKADHGMVQIPPDVVAKVKAAIRDR
jgi:predicted small metal-binding protein